MPFPTKKYQHLSCLQKAWQVDKEDLYYVIENGLLKTSIWLPLCYVERGIMQARKFIYKTHEHVEGFVGVRPEDTRFLFSNGHVKLHTFYTISKPEHALRLAYEPPQPDVIVRIGDLVVLKSDRDAFEADYHITNDGNGEKLCLNKDTLVASNDYRHIVMGGAEYHLGDVQAKIIAMLHNAAKSRNPWVHGKTLMYESGSSAMRVRDAFKHKRDWRNIICSNDRGYYRLNVPLEEFNQPPTDSSP